MTSPRLGDVVGTVRRRLLVNTWVDPAEVAPLLPDGVRPHIGSTGGVIAGCCMIEIDSARPWPMPQRVGFAIRAAAHRISVDVGPASAPTRAVYVPGRTTDSRMAVLAGGRAFPGVHLPSDVSVRADQHELDWSAWSDTREAEGFDIAATATTGGAVASDSEVADIVVGTVLGLSPGHRPGRIEAVEMHLADQRVRAVDLTNLESRFLQRFTTAVPAESLLMTDTDVVWRPGRSGAAHARAA